MLHRFLSLDTETTGLDFHRGDKLVEIAIVEMIDRKLTGNNFHRYINPLRTVDPQAFKVHGLSNSFLSTKPVFNDIAADILKFIDGDDLIIHNAEFDLTFLSGELAISGHASIESLVLDTLEWAKTMEPGKRASLDAMADRHNVNRGDRLLHGALIDAKILAEVYVSMTRKQSGLDLFNISELDSSSASIVRQDCALFNSQLVKSTLSEDELLSHQAYLKILDGETIGSCVWSRNITHQQGTFPEGSQAF